MYNKGGIVCVGNCQSHNRDVSIVFLVVPELVRAELFSMRGFDPVVKLCSEFGGTGHGISDGYFST